MSSYFLQMEGAEEPEHTVSGSVENLCPNIFKATVATSCDSVHSKAEGNTRWHRGCQRSCGTVSLRWSLAWKWILADATCPMWLHRLHSDLWVGKRAEGWLMLPQGWKAPVNLHERLGIRWALLTSRRRKWLGSSCQSQADSVEQMNSYIPVVTDEAVWVKKDMFAWVYLCNRILWTNEFTAFSAWRYMIGKKNEIS